MNLEVDVKRKATVRISKKDLQKLLAENEQMAQHITDLQTRLNELLEENRNLKMDKEAREIQDAVEKDPDPSDIFDPPPAPHHDPHPFINPNIYFDGSNGLGSGRRFGSNE